MAKKLSAMKSANVVDSRSKPEAHSSNGQAIGNLQQHFEMRIHQAMNRISDTVNAQGILDDYYANNKFSSATIQRLDPQIRSLRNKLQQFQQSQSNLADDAHPGAVYANGNDIGSSLRG